MERKHILTNKGVVCLLSALCCLLWGSAVPCIKVGYKVYEIASNDIFSQMLFAGVRFALAGVLTIVVGSMVQKKVLLPKKSSWVKINLLALFQTALQYILFYGGMAHTSGVRGSIIQASGVFFGILYAGLLFRQEKITRIKGLGCALGFMGVVLINLTKDMFSGGVSFFGEGFMLIAAASAAMGVVLFKRYAGIEGPVVLSGWQFFLGGGVMVVVGLLGGGKMDAAAWWAWWLLLYMSVLSAVAQAIWALLLRHNSVSRVIVYQFLIPVFGVFFSLLVLNERSQVPMIQCLTALILVSAGILIINRPEKQKEGNTQIT